MAECLLSLQLNYTFGQKAPLLINMVQRGLDIYGAQANGGYWGDGGGHNVGRKAVMVMAATVLNNATILTACQNITVHSEDQQTFSVSQSDINLSHTSVWAGSPNFVVAQNYIQSDLGLAEWGMNHQDQAYEDDKTFPGAPYRTTAGSCQVGNVLAMMMMGITNTWNHPVYFDYFIRRYVPTMLPQSAFDPNDILPNVADMWNAYANSAPGPTVAQPVISPGAISSLTPVTMTMSDTTAGANIYYTSDGTTPSAASTLYGLPIIINTPPWLKRYRNLLRVCEQFGCFCEHRG